MEEKFWFIVYFAGFATYLGTTAKLMSQKKFGWFGFHGAFTIFFLIQLIKTMLGL